ncbi:MAG: hypothetical protein CMB45_05000 [Euryarchaeota archaeon]|nr:hypothetical protein [Euryarchaeota archaeon]|tara:strand:- start:24244 stop:24738 length:495 start_codon:yes stop_codon:yes gene_type:complete
MDIRKRLGTIEEAHSMAADGAIPPLSQEGSDGLLSTGLLHAKSSQIIDPNNYPSKSLTYLLNHKPLRFTVREWYGDIDHILLEDAGTHLVYCVGCGEGAWYIVYVYRDLTQNALEKARSWKLPYPFVVMSTNTSSRNEEHRERGLDWTVNSFRIFGFDPYQRLR